MLYFLCKMIAGWFHAPTQAELDEERLKSSVDISDLENRMRQMDRRLPSYF